MMEQSHQTTVKNRQYPFATTARIAAQLKATHEPSPSSWRSLPCC